MRPARSYLGKAIQKIFLWNKHIRNSFTNRNIFKTSIFLSLAICGLFLSIFVTHSLVNALSRDFVQTSWSGGVDTVTTIDLSNISGWTKYYSKTDGIDASTTGEIKLNLTIIQP